MIAGSLRSHGWLPEKVTLEPGRGVYKADGSWEMGTVCHTEWGMFYVRRRIKKNDEK